MQKMSVYFYILGGSSFCNALDGSKAMIKAKNERKLSKPISTTDQDQDDETTGYNSEIKKMKFKQIYVT